MSGVQKSLFFLGLPDLKKLVCVTLTVQEEDEEPRSKQIKTCRELVLLYSDLLASPGLDSFNEITVVMAMPFFQKGIVQMFGQRRSLQLGSPQCVFPGVLQCCLSYSLIARLAPGWNKAGLYLITGKDFLTERGRLNAVSMELNTCEGRLCISVEANTVQLPPTTLQDFDLPPLVLRKFCSDPDSILDQTSIGGAIWCHVLPSMKKGQIIYISRKLPKDGPFRAYRDLQNHWNCLYGYRLPELAEEEAVYCSVYFRPVGERLFTYPLSCIRLQPVQRCPRPDLQGAPSSFLSDIRDRLQSVCGFPARLTNKPCYHTASLNSAASVQVLSSEQVNLSSSCSSVRPAVAQLPAPPAPPAPPRPLMPPPSQPPAWPPLSRQDGAQGLLGNGCEFRSSLTQSQGRGGDEDWPSSSSSSSSSCVSFTFSGNQPAPPLSSSSSISLPSPLVSPLPPPSQTSLMPPPKLVPIFRNKCPSQQVNMALLRLQKQKEQLGGGGEERGRVSLPAYKKMTPAAAPLPVFPPSVFPSSAGSLPAPPPPAAPRFSRHPEPPRPGAHPKLRHLLSLSPPSRFKPGQLAAPKLEIKFKSRTSPKTNAKTSFESKTAADFRVRFKEELQPSAALPEPPPPLMASDVSSKHSSSSSSSRQEAVLKSNLKKPRSAVRDVDMLKMARSNQLSKLNSATLLSWLKARGVLVTAKHKKEELMLKIMGCLAEA